MKIANIIHNSELVNHTKNDLINYYNEFTDEIDYKLPTLVVGWFFLKENLDIFKEFNISISDKTIIKSNIFWEFSFDEDKQEHINGVIDFVHKIVDLYFLNNYNYINYCPIFNQIKSINEFKDGLPNKFDLIYLSKSGNNAYGIIDDTIYGIDLLLFDNLKLNSDDIINHLKTIGDVCYGNELKTDIKLINNHLFNEILESYMVVIVKNDFDSIYNK